ncbi:MAG: prolyl oligopeptidase family serine peptidase [Candidatus Thorarchaeota archaeon]|jgi:dipeptidyl aminopeptidase/acylaminoacyl peptidase
MHSHKAIDLDAMMTLPQISKTKVSPSKRYIALMVNRIQENYDVFLKTTYSTGDLVPLTKTPEVTYIHDWAPDSKSILVGEDKARNERTTLYRVFLESPFEMHPITQQDPNFYVYDGQFGPRGDYIAYAMNYDMDTKRETETFRIVIHDLESNQRTVVARPDKPAYPELDVDPNNRYILYSRSDEDPSGTQWWIVSLDGDEDREILNFGPTAKVEAQWTHDGLILFNTDTFNGERTNTVSVGLLDISSGNIDWLSTPTAGGTYSFSHVPDHSHHILVGETIEAKKKPYIYDLQTNLLSSAISTTGNLWPITNLEKDEWLGLYYSSTSPYNIVKFNLDSLDPQTFTPITDILGFSTVQKEDLTPAEDFRWISEDNTMIHGWLYKASNPNGKTIVFVHGGPTAHSRDALSIQIQYFCSLGYNVLDPNYRGSTGYGVNFRELIKKDGWGGLDKEDVRTGIETLIEKGISIPHKVGIYGTSYGGYMSWNAITHFPTKVVAAAAPICGMTDLVVDYETTRPDLRPLSEEMMGGSPTEVPEIYSERSPINYVQNIQGKLLIIQGLRDPNVTKANVAEVEKKLEKHGIQYEKLVFDDEGHGIIRQNNVKTLLERLVEFFDSSL